MLSQQQQSNCNILKLPCLYAYVRVSLLISLQDICWDFYALSTEQIHMLIKHQYLKTLHPPVNEHSISLCRPLYFFSDILQSFYREIILVSFCCCYKTHTQKQLGAGANSVFVLHLKTMVYP